MGKTDQDAYEPEPCEKPITVTPDDHIVRLGSIPVSQWVRIVSVDF